jgi:hypothetical protein
LGGNFRQKYFPVKLILSVGKNPRTAAASRLPGAGGRKIPCPGGIPALCNRRARV